MNLLYAAWHYIRYLPSHLPLVLTMLAASVALFTWSRLPTEAGTARRDASLAAWTVLGFAALDWGLMAALRWLNLSFGPLEMGLTGLAAVRLAALILAILATLAWQKLHLTCRHVAGPGPTAESTFPSSASTGHDAGAGLLIFWLLNLGVLACAVDGLYIEPFNLHTTHIVATIVATNAGLSANIAPDHPAPLSLVVTTSVVADPPGPHAPSAPSLRIVHLSDIHVEYITRREREMLERVRQLQPDLILMTGDYLNIDYTHDPQTQQAGRAVLSQLSAPYGVYAIPGSPPVDTTDALQAVFNGLDITLLQDEIRRLEVKGQEIYLVGVSVRRGRDDAQAMRRLVETIPPGAFTILLYHTPDLAEAAAQAGVNLYLAGHTHGGQIRLPWYGALVTSSAYGKRFEAGLYPVGQTSLYVSRGIGMEGLRLPRARLLCPPEIVVIDLYRWSSP